MCYCASGKCTGAEQNESRAVFGCNATVANPRIINPMKFKINALR